MTRQIFACCTMWYFERFWIFRSLNYPFWGLNFGLATQKPQKFRSCRGEHCGTILRSLEFPSLFQALE